MIIIFLILRPAVQKAGLCQYYNGRAVSILWETCPTWSHSVLDKQEISTCFSWDKYKKLILFCYYIAVWVKFYLGLNHLVYHAE